MNQIQIVQIDRDELFVTFEGIVKSAFDKLLSNLKAEKEPVERETYLTPAETAEFLKVNLSTISNWRKAGTLKSYIMGGRVYIKRTDIDKCMVRLKSQNEEK